jgi:hypothetical protein
MTGNTFLKRHRFICGLLMLFAFFSHAHAQPLEDVSLEYQDRGIVATIRLSGPVQYLRHFPESHGKTLEIYYDRAQGATTSETWVDNEVRKSPPSSLIPSFTVTTRDQQSKPKLVIEFSREAEYSVVAGKDNRSLLITIRPEKRPVGTGPLPFLPTIKPEAAAAPAAALSAEEANLVENTKQARALMIQGRDALAAKNNEAAVDAFNKLLLLPPTDYTQDAQEWVGVARERATQIDKARIEYELYLRLYPEGDGAARVAQRLAGLAGKGTGQATAATDGEKKQAARWMTFGSISSRYYYGKSNIDTTYTFNNAATSSSLSLTDQSMLITTEDVSARYVSEDYDGRLVFRDVSTKNFLSTQPSLNRVNALYGEIKNRTQDYLVRVGRQSATGGGVLGRFDGAFGSYGNAENYRVNAVAGALADYSQGSKPNFVGASVDSGAFSFYGINQTVDGVVDRRAVGAEWRYFEDKNTAFAQLDYDTVFKSVNTAQFMGTTGVSGMTVNYMVDHRKSPSLSIRNALNGSGTSSINELLQTKTTSDLRNLALERTATSNMGQIGVTLPFNEKWQVGGDVRLTNTSGLPASGTNTVEGIFAGLPSRGTEKSATVQIIGSSLYTIGDIWSASTTLSSGSSVRGNSIYFFNHTQFSGGWVMDTSLQLYSQTDQFGGTTKSTMPMVRGSYRFREQLTVDVDCGYQSVSNNGALQASKAARTFYSAGLRWDF